MAIKAFNVTEIEQGGVHESKGNLRLVCLIEGGGKLAVWGSAATRKNIDTVQCATMPCNIECDWIPPSDWANKKFGHTHWVPEGNILRILPSQP
jgi:hypothetical protein